MVGKDFAFYLVNTQPNLQAIISELIDLTGQLSDLANTMVSKSPDSTPLAPVIATKLDAIGENIKAIEVI